MRKDAFWFLLLIFVVTLFWFPTLNVQPPLSTGDNGRDLYAFWMTLQGKWPCRDYWWQYGPAMPLYYAFWFWVGGVHLISLRIGLGVIFLLSSLLSFRTLRLFTSPAVAFLASLSFLNLDIIHTFNHVGTFPFLILSIFSLFKFFLTRRIRWCYLGTLALAGMALVKINAGVTSFSAFFTSLFFWSVFRNLGWKHLIPLPFLFGGIVLGIYALLYWGLPLSWVDQCLTWRKVYHLEYSVWGNLKHLVLFFCVWDRRRLLGVGAFLLLGALGLLGLRKGKFSSSELKLFAAVMVSLLLFETANSAEFFQIGYITRFDFWSFPIFLLVAGLWAEWASHLFGSKTKIFLGSVIFLMVLWNPFRDIQTAFANRIPERYLDIPHGQVYLEGPLPDVEVIKKVAHFILENTKPHEEIFAITYEPLYCFLAGRRHAVRELLFHEHMQISEKQEEAMIRQLELKRIPFVLFSSDYRSRAWGVGVFGKTHCRKLGRYIAEHYQEVTTFGPWQEDPPRFVAVKILKKTG